MQLLIHAKGRIREFLLEVNRLDQCEFPYQHSQAALHRIREVFEKKLAIIEKLDSQSDPAVVKQVCKLSLHELFVYVPLLGFILRSTNVRNAFKVFGPLLRLSRQILEPGVDKQNQSTRLVLSSEWDYSPFVYGEIPELPGFVLIGLPAPESANPLLLPLAGHELGHSLWAIRKLGNSFTASITQNVLDVIKQKWAEFTQFFLPSNPPTHSDLTSNFLCVQFWEQSLKWAMRQAEESFCDFIGVCLFGESYLHAFAYLLSPSTEGPRSLYYPNLRDRVRNLGRAATQYGFTALAGYEDMFEDMAKLNLMQSDDFLLAVADAAVDRSIPAIIACAKKEVQNSGLDGPSASEIERVYARFEHVVPAEGCKRVSDIICAGWRAFQNDQLWNDIPEIVANKERNLKELVLKNIEVFEIEQILEEA